jgi:glycosyltransferase involved in cell wall biosynthesis
MSEMSRLIQVDEIDVISIEPKVGTHPPNQGENLQVRTGGTKQQVTEPGAALPHAKPSVSVIIPFTRAETIGGVIESILAEGSPQGQLEIIVVGNGSSHLLQEWPELRVVDDGMKYSPGRARNQGAKHASAETLIFIDDDCEAQRGWLVENLAELSTSSVGAVGGMISSKSRSLISQALDFANFGMCQTVRRQERPICSATFAIRKALFLEVGGFDQELQVHEDIDLCHRLHVRGYKTVYQPRVRVVHNHQRSSLGLLLRYMYFSGRQGGLRI